MRKEKISIISKQGSKISEALQRLFTYIKNNKGPSIDPWGTPQAIFAKFVFLLLKDTLFTISKVTFEPADGVTIYSVMNKLF